MRIAIDTEKLANGDTKATYTDVNGKKVEHIDSDINEACRRATDKAKLGIIDGSLQVQR